MLWQQVEVQCGLHRYDGHDTIFNLDAGGFKVQSYRDREQLNTMACAKR